MNQITEKEVTEWMIARLNQIRETGLKARVMSVSVNLYDQKCPKTDWTMHTVEECVVSQPSSTEAEGNLRKLCFCEPAIIAGRKRDEAKRLLEQADELERQVEPANKTGRPQ